MLNNEYHFTGPLFIVGMPRSGTKLLRGLLNEGRVISILSIETEFLPYWVENWRKFGDLSQRPIFSRFYKQMTSKLPYFTYMNERNALIEEDEWYESCRSFDPGGVFEALARHDAKAPFDTNRIWGDKSPSYINHIPMLKVIFPQAKIIHIIRDVRDYCLSLNQAWGKNMLRAAQRWVDSVEKARQDGAKLGSDYLEVQYENILKEPELELSRICNFVDIEFDISMLALSSSTENIGDAKGERTIVRSNLEKYTQLMPQTTRKEIELISAHTLKACGYPVAILDKPQRVPNWKMVCYQAADFINLVKSEAKQRGIVEAIKFHFRYSLFSGN